MAQVIVPITMVAVTTAGSNANFEGPLVSIAPLAFGLRPMVSGAHTLGLGSYLMRSGRMLQAFDLEPWSVAHWGLSALWLFGAEG